MTRWGLKLILAFAFVSAGMIITGSVIADKPPWAGGGKKGQEKHQEIYQEGSGESLHGNSGEHHRYFTDENRVFIQNYYSNRYQHGHCPPGLAKKHNGCMPPGQAKKWEMGRPLPREVIFYELPPKVLDQLGPPPPHHRFVRVAQDILLIATGTGMVVDAIEDLNWEFSHH